jgi:hypothetical protein
VESDGWVSFRILAAVRRRRAGRVVHGTANGALLEDELVLGQGTRLVAEHVVHLPQVLEQGRGLDDHRLVGPFVVQIQIIGHEVRLPE